MTFTYAIEDTDDDIAFIRLHIQDTEEDGAKFTDEEISRVLADESDDKDRAIDKLLTIIKIKMSKEPTALQIGATAVRQDVGGRLKAIDSGQKRYAALESSVPNFDAGSIIVTREEDS